MIDVLSIKHVKQPNLTKPTIWGDGKIKKIWFGESEDSHPKEKMNEYLSKVLG